MKNILITITYIFAVLFGSIMDRADMPSNFLKSAKFWIGCLAIAFLTLALSAHAATIAYGTPPAVASEITEDLRGLPNVPYTIQVSNGPMLEMGILCDGVTWISDRTITVNAYQSKGNLDFTVFWEYSHAYFNNADESESCQFVKGIMAARGEAYTHTCATAAQQALEDAYNVGKSK